MELQSITKEIYDATKRLDEAGHAVYKLALEKAETEREYRLALSQRITTLKAEGMSVTLISDVARGDVADLKFNRDLAEGKYKASMQALEALKAQVNALQTISKYQSEV